MIQLHNGDCLDIMPLIPDKSVDMILCDLPYGTTACKWDSVIPFELLWKQYKRIIKDNGATLLFATQPFGSKIINSNIDEFKHEWIWNKKVSGNFINAKYAPLRIHESILLFSKKSPQYFPIMTDADLGNNRPVSKSNHTKGIYNGIKSGEFKENENRSRDKRYPVTILEYSSREKECNPINRLHPTQKPVPLLEYLIKTYTKEGDTVLDNAMGSGSTGVACNKSNRHFIGIEKDPMYFEISKKRLAELEFKNIENVFKSFGHNIEIIKKI
jgi:site-specific DNA-methyltransferase (adenine-specific)